MNTASAVLLASGLGLLVGFVLGQFYNLDLRTWKGNVPLIAFHKRERKRKLPWDRVLGTALVIVMVITLGQFAVFQIRQENCNEEQRRVSQERGAASVEDSRLVQRDQVNLGVAIRELLGQPQPQSPAVLKSYEDLQLYLLDRGIVSEQPSPALSEATLDWFQQEQLETIETREKNDAVRAANPYPNPRC